MEKVRRSGAFYIALLGHIDDTCDNLNDAQKELTEILSDLKVKQTHKKKMIIYYQNNYSLTLKQSKVWVFFNIMGQDKERDMERTQNCNFNSKNPLK